MTVSPTVVRSYGDSGSQCHRRRPFLFPSWKTGSQRATQHLGIVERTESTISWTDKAMDNSPTSFSGRHQRQQRLDRFSFEMDLFYSTRHDPQIVPIGSKGALYRHTYNFIGTFKVSFFLDLNFSSLPGKGKMKWTWIKLKFFWKIPRTKFSRRQRPFQKWDPFR